MTIIYKKCKMSAYIPTGAHAGHESTYVVYKKFHGRKGIYVETLSSRGPFFRNLHWQKKKEKFSNFKLNLWHLKAIGVYREILSVTSNSKIKKRRKNISRWVCCGVTRISILGSTPECLFYWSQYCQDLYRGHKSKDIEHNPIENEILESPIKILGVSGGFKFLEKK